MKVLLQIIRPLNPSDQEKLCQFGGNIGDRFAFFILGGKPRNRTGFPFGHLGRSNMDTYLFRRDNQRKS
jgi:hypothetical protein